VGDAFELEIKTGDLLKEPADVALLKYARSFHGADAMVASALEKAGLNVDEIAPEPGRAAFLETKGGIAASLACYLGTPALRQFGYHEVRTFAGQALELIAARAPQAKKIVTTVHGVHSGLDENEALLSLAGGFIEAFEKGAGPKSLERITIVEVSAKRAKRLAETLEASLGKSAGVSRTSSGAYRIGRSAPQPATIASAGGSNEKAHAFVAMPFLPELEDTFHYGIFAPVRAAGLLCERVDQAVFDGPIIQRIRDRIETAKVVIADLSTGNANVYLEVGYAWGKGKPTILLVRDVKELKFDVQSYRCLVYGNIRQLEQQLTKELERLT
jgi:hypothetical protein